MRTGVRAALAVPAVAVLTVAAWYAWLGWDTGYDVDPSTGAVSGPYQWWQVAGCVFTLAAIAVLATLIAPAWAVAGALTLAFTAAWSARAASSDDSGLWVVGAVLVLLGTAAGSALLTGVTARAVRRGRRVPG